MDLFVSSKYRAFTCFLLGREYRFLNVKIINRLGQQKEKFILMKMIWKLVELSELKHNCSFECPFSSEAIKCLWFWCILHCTKGYIVQKFIELYPLYIYDTLSLHNFYKDVLLLLASHCWHHMTSSGLDRLLRLPCDENLGRCLHNLRQAVDSLRKSLVCLPSLDIWQTYVSHLNLQWNPGCHFYCVNLARLCVTDFLHGMVSS